MVQNEACMGRWRGKNEGSYLAVVAQVSYSSEKVVVGLTGSFFLARVKCK